MRNVQITDYGYAPQRFVKVTFDESKIKGPDGKNVRPVFLHVTAERTMKIGHTSFEVIVGRAVDRNGEDLNRIHMIEKGTIKHLTEYRQSLTYGTLDRIS